jgi:hypothetical protein
LEQPHVPNSTEIKAEILTSDGVTLCKQVQVIVTKAKHVTGEADVSRGLFALQHCQRPPHCGETLVLRYPDGSEDVLVVVDVTANAVHFRIRAKSRTSS